VKRRGRNTVYTYNGWEVHAFDTSSNRKIKAIQLASHGMYKLYIEDAGNEKILLMRFAFIIRISCIRKNTPKKQSLG
jgi:hypothetical protein